MWKNVAWNEKWRNNYMGFLIWSILLDNFIKHIIFLPGSGWGTTKYFIPAIFTTDCASIGLKGVAPLPIAGLFFTLRFPLPPVGVNVTEGMAFALAVDGPKAEVIVVEPKKR